MPNRKEREKRRGRGAAQKALAGFWVRRLRGRKRERVSVRKTTGEDRKRKGERAYMPTAGTVKGQYGKRGKKGAEKGRTALLDGNAVPGVLVVRGEAGCAGPYSTISTMPTQRRERQGEKD